MGPIHVHRAWLACGLATLVGVAAGAELEPRAQRALDRLAAEQRELDAEYADELAELEARATALREHHLAELAEARADAIADLKRATNSRDPIAEQALVQREILRLDPDDAEARSFFEALGTLDQELADRPAPAAGPVSVDLAAATMAPPTAAELLAAGIPFRVYREQTDGSRSYILEYHPDVVTLANTANPDRPFLRSTAPPEIRGDIISCRWIGNRGWMEIPTALGFEPMDGRAAGGRCSVQQIPLHAAGPDDDSGIQAQQR